MQFLIYMCDRFNSVLVLTSTHWANIKIRPARQVIGRKISKLFPPKSGRRRLKEVVAYERWSHVEVRLNLYIPRVILVQYSSSQLWEKDIYQT